MRLWTLHPRHLDAAGLTALWREALLAQAVLRGRTRGYRHHPQLARFRAAPSPRAAINAYLAGVHAEATARGYRFDRSKLGRTRATLPLVATRGQLDYEWQWLLDKLRRRSPEAWRRARASAGPDAHPLFALVDGPVSDWERAIGRAR
jgi:hypothetical protein